MPYVYNPFIDNLDNTGSGGGSSSGNRVLIESQTASASSSIEFVTGVTGYDLYEITFYGVTTLGNGATKRIVLQLSTNAGSSWITSADYYVGGVYSGASSGGGNYSINGETYVRLLDNNDDASATPCSSNIQLSSLGSTTLNKTLQAWTTGAGSNVYYVSISASVLTLSAINGIKIFPINGTFTTGTFNLYGIV